MAKNIDSDYISQKNELHDDGSWLFLWEVEVSEIETAYIVNNPEEVFFDGVTYSPFPIEWDGITESRSGDLPFTSVTVSNVNQAVETLLQTRNGLLDREVTMKLVHSNHLSKTTPAFTQTFTIREASSNAEAVTFSLSAHPFLETNLPHQRFTPMCRWQFRSGECGWVDGQGGNPSICSKQLRGTNGCEAHNNTARFGGFESSPRAVN